MRLIKQVAHIAYIFGPLHAARRVAQALKANFDEWRRTRRHRRRVKSSTEKETIVCCLGKLFSLNISDFGLHRDLISDRIREPVATSLMMRYASIDDVLLDAGANIGYFSLVLADRVRQVHAIEPDAENYKSLKKNISLNATKNISTYNIALSDSNEPLFLARSKKSNWHKTLKRKPPGASEIEALTIDSFCALNDVTPTLMKMDIEGFEKYVFKGAQTTLSGLRYLFFELHSSFLSIEEVNDLLDHLDATPLKLKHIIRYDRPGLWKEEPLSLIDSVRRGDFGIYELIYAQINTPTHSQVP